MRATHRHAPIARGVVAVQGNKQNGDESHGETMACGMLRGGAVQSFAYYSKWKPRTCSVHIVRGDAYSTWEDYGHRTTVTTENGTFLIENGRNEVRFHFREVDRMFYCGMEGKIRGRLAVKRGKRECELEGVMDEESDK